MSVKIMEQEENIEIESQTGKRPFFFIFFPVFLAGWLYQGIGILKGGIKENMAVFGSTVIGYDIIFIIVFLGAIFVILAFAGLFSREIALLKKKKSLITIEKRWGHFRTSYREIPLTNIESIKVETYPRRRGRTGYRILINCGTEVGRVLN